VFCPSCKDEFRPGFTRCARCNVDLVDDLDRAAPSRSAPQPAPAYPVRMAEYCGFLSLDDARHARDRLRHERIRSEIVLREPPDVDWNGPVREEAWLRVEAARLREVAVLLGDIPELEVEGEADEATFECGNCGHDVAEDESFCPKCGARFEG